MKIETSNITTSYYTLVHDKDSFPLLIAQRGLVFYTPALVHANGAEPDFFVNTYTRCGVNYSRMCTAYTRLDGNYKNLEEKIRRKTFARFVGDDIKKFYLFQYRIPSEGSLFEVFGESFYS